MFYSFIIKNLLCLVVERFILINKKFLKLENKLFSYFCYVVNNFLDIL